MNYRNKGLTEHHSHKPFFFFLTLSNTFLNESSYCCRMLCSKWHVIFSLCGLIYSGTQSPCHSTSLLLSLLFLLHSVHISPCCLLYIYRLCGHSAEFCNFPHFSAWLKDNEISEFSWEPRVVLVHVIFKMWKHENKYFCMGEKHIRWGHIRQIKEEWNLWKGISKVYNILLR